MRSHFFVFFLVVACGGGSKSRESVVTVPSASASAKGGISSAALGPLPPMAAMPPPGVLGSRKAKTRSDSALYACGAGSNLAAKDPAEQVKRIGEACAAATKMKPLGSPFRGQDGDTDPPRDHKFRAEANKCYRVYFATDENVKDAVLVLRDSTGNVVAESPGAALPEDGALCFNTTDEVSLSVSVGAGKGSYTAQVWGD